MQQSSVVPVVRTPFAERQQVPSRGMERLEEGSGVPDSAVLSAEGPLQANEEQRKLLCYLANGWLLVAEGYVLDQHVQSYIAQLGRQKKPHKIVLTSVRMIFDVYAAATGSNGKVNDETAMQRKARDIIEDATKHRASDIHIRIRKDITEVLYRVHGDLQPVMQADVEWGNKLIRTYYHSMADISDDSFKAKERMDARIASRDKLPDNVYGVRIATTPTDEGNLMVLRMLYNDTSDSTDPIDLGFAEDHAAMLQLMKESPIGMNIICGPTGSGKSTSLQRILKDQIRQTRGTRHVITVEDPPEYPIENAIQTPVTNAPTAELRGQYFSEAIASAMRLDPDTIMVGEIRDLASAQMALRAALTGHQVWTTIHAPGVFAIIDRLCDLGIPLEMIADHNVLTGLVSQRLVKSLCPNCKLDLFSHTDLVSSDLVERVQRTVGVHWDKVYVTNPKGCSHCNHTGSRGRTVVAEVLVPDPKLMEHVRHGRKVEARRHWLKEQHGRTMLQHAIDKIKEGDLDPAVAERFVGRITMHDLLEDDTLTVGEIVQPTR